MVMVMLVPFGVSAQTQTINPRGLIDEHIEWDLGNYNYSRLGNSLLKPDNVLGDPGVAIFENWKLAPYAERPEDYFFQNIFGSNGPIAWSDGEYVENIGSKTVVRSHEGEFGQYVRLFSPLHLPGQYIDPVYPQVENLVILIHGWNPSANSFHYGGAFEPLWRNLEELLEGTDWGLTRYDWSKDAATGGFSKGAPTNPFLASVEAASIGDSHGRHLGKLLRDNHPNLKRVILMCHSAGTWVGYRAAKTLLMHNSAVEVELMLMDPYIPGSLPGAIVGNTPLAAGRIRSLDGFGGDRVYLHNYYGEDGFLAFGSCIGELDWGGVASTLAFGTESRFGWSAPHIEHSTDEVYWPGPGDDPCTYGGHEGPILFMADVIAHMLGRPSERWNDEWNGRYGLENSLFTKWKLHEQAPIVRRQDETLAQTYTRVAQEWRDLGFVDITTLDVHREGIHWSDRFEVRNGRLFVLMNGLPGETLIRALNLWLPGFEPPQGSSGNSGAGGTIRRPSGPSLNICIPGHDGFAISDRDQSGLNLKETNGAQLDSFVIEGWMNMQPLNDVLVDCVIMQKRDGDLGWELCLANGGRDLQFFAGDLGEGGLGRRYLIHQARNVIMDEDIRQWAHFLVAVSLSDGTAVMYKNGEALTVETPLRELTMIHHAEGKPFVFGASRLGDGNPREYHGLLRDWSVWKNRTIEEVKQLNWIRGDEGGLLAHWRFIEFTLENGIIDVTGKNHLHFGQWSPQMATDSYTYEEWTAVQNAVFAEGDRLPDVVASGNAADSAKLPSPTHHFAFNGAELLGDKLLDSIGGIRLDAEDSSGRLGNAVGYDGDATGAFFINDTSRRKPAYLALRSDETRLRFNHEPFALGMWIQIPEGSMSDGDRFLAGFISHKNSRNHKLSLEVEGNGTVGTGYGELSVSGGNIADAGWHHVMVTVNYIEWTDEANRRFEVTLYVDGVPVEMQSRKSSSLLVAGSDHELHIGGHPQHNHWFYGNVDEVMLWQNTEVTAAQVAAYYSSQTP